MTTLYLLAEPENVDKFCVNAVPHQPLNDNTFTQETR